MKALILPLALATLNLFFTETGDGQLLKKIKDRVSQKAEEKIDKKEPEKTEQPEKADTPETPGTTEQPEKAESTATPAPAPSFKTYQNYDFVPGDKVLFEDNFKEDQDGEFPAHWELKDGQGIMNKINGEPAFFLTDGNYVRVFPRMKTASYLTDPFTIEFDYYFVPDAYGILTMLRYNDPSAGSEQEDIVSVNSSEASISGDQLSFSKPLPEALAGENFVNKWHHIAIAYKNRQVKVYVDQYRALVVPDAKHAFEKMQFAGIADETHPLILNNVRIAAGGGMNMIGKKFTESKLVTHGINFDYNKATIKPESMGTLNMVVNIMKENPGIKFEIGGYTDSDGDDQYNLRLSDQRAAAVLKQLVSMGVDASRLTSKGYGEANPISDNTSSEGKANNRRVEFVKK